MTLQLILDSGEKLTAVELADRLEKGELTAAKAKKILKDGEVNGQPLTDQQKKFFGAIAGGETPIQKADDPKSPEEEERRAAKKEEKKDPKPPPIPGVKKSGIDDLANFGKGDDASPLITVAELGQIIQAGQEHFAKADDGKPGESLKETSTKELAATLKDIVARLRGDPEDAAALQKRREAIKTELNTRTPPDFGGGKAKKSENPDGRVYIDEEGTFESIEALQGMLEKCMVGSGSGRGILEWADQFYNTPWHLQSLQCIKDRNECARKQNKMWKDEVPYQDRRQWSGARRGEYEVKREKEHEQYRKESDAIRERMDALEAKLIDYRLDQEKAEAKKSAVDDLDDFAKGKQANEQEDDMDPKETLAKAGEESGADVLEKGGTISVAVEPGDTVDSVLGRVAGELKKAGDPEEPAEEPADQSGIDELAGFAKAQALPQGKPKQKLGVGQEQGGKLAGVGKTAGDNTSGGGPGQDAQGQVKAPGSKKDKLSDDDADEEGQMKTHKKPIESARKSVSPANQRDMVAQEQAAAVAQLKKGEEDVEAGNGTPPEPEEAPELEKGRVGQQGMVQYSEASDLAVERLQKGGGFYTGGSPQVVPFSRPIGVGKECPRCKTALSKSLTACPECGLGTTVHRVLPGGEAQGDHDGEPIVKSKAGKLRPRIEEDVILVPK